MKLTHILAGILISAGLCPKVSLAQKDQRPNVIIIMVDDMNKWAIKNDYQPLKTPNIQKLKSESLVFENATTAAAICVPSRAAFFSGKYPFNSGIYKNGPDPWGRSEVLKDVDAIPELFKKSGYITWGGGKSFHAPLPDQREQKMFDNKVNNGNYGPFFNGKGQWNNIKAWEGPDTDFPDVVTVNSASEFLKEKHDKPFFMYVGIYRPHSPYTAPKRFFEMYNGVDFPNPPGYIADDLTDIPQMGKDLVDGASPLNQQKLPGGEMQQDYLKAYCANYSFSDWNIGRMIDAIDNSPYAENTIIIFISDNGFHNGTKNHWTKQTPWEQASSVPLMVRLPSKKGTVQKQTVNSIDIFPTLVEYSQLKAPKQQLDGISFVSILKNPNATWTRPGNTTIGGVITTLRSERYRYIHYPDGSRELYDHSTDDYENDNIESKPEMKAVIADFLPFLPKSFIKSVSLADDPNAEGEAQKKGKKKPANKKEGTKN